MAEAALIVGGAIFVVLGFLHALYTFTDIRRPRRIVPEDAAVIEAMKGTGVRLALPRAALAVPVVVNALYLWLAIKYWFRIPLAGIALATALFVIAFVGY